MSENEKVWLYLQGDQPTGPVTSGYLALLMSAGRLPPTTLVWRPGMASWVSAAEVGQITSQCAPPSPSPSLQFPPPVRGGPVQVRMEQGPARTDVSTFSPSPSISPSAHKGPETGAFKKVFLRWAGWSLALCVLAFIRMMVVDMKVGGLPLFFSTAVFVGVGIHFFADAYGRREPLGPSAAGCLVGLVGTWLLLIFLVGVTSVFGH